LLRTCALPGVHPEPVFDFLSLPVHAAPFCGRFHPIPLPLEGVGRQHYPAPLLAPVVALPIDLHSRHPQPPHHSRYVLPLSFLLPLPRQTRHHSPHPFALHPLLLPHQRSHPSARSQLQHHPAPVPYQLLHPILEPHRPAHLLTPVPCVLSL